MNSYRYLEKEGVFLVAIEDIQIPNRDLGFKGYRSEENYLRLKYEMLSGEVLEPIEIKSKEKSGTKKYQIYHGYHRFHISLELGYESIPVRINDWDMKEFLEKEKYR